MEHISEYLIESIVPRKTGVYDGSGPLIFGKEYTTQYQDAVANLEKAKAKEFYASSSASYIRIIELRTKKFNKLKEIEYCLYPDNVQPTIIVISPGPLEYGKTACVLRYHKDRRQAGVTPMTKTSLVATHYIQYDGTKWTQVAGPDLGGYNNPREYQDEINGMLYL